MSEFSVKPGQMRMVASQQQEVERELSRLCTEMLSIKRQLSFKVVQRERIDRRLDALRKTIAEEQTRIRRCTSVLESSAGFYEKTELSLCGIDLPDTVEEYDLVDGENAETALREAVRQALKIMGNYGDSDSCKLSDATIAYVEALYQFLTGEKRGGEGAKDLSAVAKEGVKVFKALYKMLCGGMTEENRKMFQAQWGDRVKGAEAFGGFAGFFGSLLEVMDQEGKSASQRIGDFTDLTKDSVKLISYTGDPKNPYWKIGQTAIASLGSAAERYIECMKDGELSIGDWGDMLVSGSMAGLNELVSEITDVIKDITFGKIDINLNDYTNAVKHWADQLGRDAADRIAADPYRLEQYRNANGLQRVGMIFGETLFPSDYWGSSILEGGSMMTTGMQSVVPMWSASMVQSGGGNGGGGGVMGGR